MNRRTESRRAFDVKRYASKPGRQWYQTKAWKVRRRAQLAAVPWCETCRAAGRSRPATVADHDPPHCGDWKAFHHGRLRSLCKPCHDSAAQREETLGFSREIGEDGWPRDPKHIFYSREK